MNESRFETLLIALAVSMSAGCSSVLAPQPDPSRFFALSAVTGASSEGSAQDVAAAGLTYGVGPVRIPDYLDRNEICTRLSASELAYSPTDRWAAPLRASIPTVLAQDLARRLGQGHVVIYPWLGERVDYQIEVDVLRFEASADGRSYLMARWVVRKGAEGRAVVMVRDSSYAQGAASKSTTASVEALSLTLDELGRDIAASVGSLPQPGTRPAERQANTRSTSPSRRP
jgi:uncharacterized lipoprotein YmbA